MAENVTCPRCKGSGMEIIWEILPMSGLVATDEKKECTLCNGTGLKEAGWEEK